MTVKLAVNRSRPSVPYGANFVYYVYLKVKALRRWSHSFTCKYTMHAFPS